MRVKGGEDTLQDGQKSSLSERAIEIFKVTIVFSFRTKLYVFIQEGV